MKPNLSLSIKEICEYIGTEYIGEDSPIITCVASLNSEKTDAISFYNGDTVYKQALKNTSVTACLIKKENAALLPKHVIGIVCENPYFAIAKVVEKMYGGGEEVPSKFLDIESLQKSDKNYHNISPLANVSSCAVIGKNVTIMAGAYIGCNVEIGDDVTVHANASLEHCVVGMGSVVRAGARIGTCGFGFVPDFKTGKHFSIPQISSVILEECVDIGANSCIDRGFLTDTKIGAFTKIDNLVHIGHGVVIGRSCFFAGGTSVAGSCVIGNFCMIGGQSAIANNVILPDFTEVLGMSGIVKGPTEKGKRIIGLPAIDHITWKRIQAFLHSAVKKKK